MCRAARARTVQAIIYIASVAHICDLFVMKHLHLHQLQGLIRKPEQAESRITSGVMI